MKVQTLVDRVITNPKHSEDCSQREQHSKGSSISAAVTGEKPESVYWTGMVSSWMVEYTRQTDDGSSGGGGGEEYEYMYFPLMSPPVGSLLLSLCVTISLVGIM